MQACIKQTSGEGSPCHARQGFHCLRQGFHYFRQGFQ